MDMTARLKTPAQNVQKNLHDKIRLASSKEEHLPPGYGQGVEIFEQTEENKALAVAPTTHRHMISANVSDGRRYAARKPSSVGEMRDINSGYPNPTNASPALTC